MRALLCLLVLILIGCSGTQDPLLHPGIPGKSARDIPVWLDTNFIQAERVEISHALNLWNEALNGHMFMYIESDKFDMDLDLVKHILAIDGFMFLRVSSSHPAVAHEHTDLTLAWANSIGGNWIYMIYNRIPIKHFDSIAAHELGHLLGVTHGGTYLMGAAYYWEEYICVDNYTARSVEKAQRLPDGALTSCNK